MFPLTLSRLTICPITATTPYCVVQEVADAHRIAYSPSELYRPEYFYRLLTTINSTTPVTLTNSREQRCWPLIARFVNSREEWTEEPLRVALAFLQQFMHCSGDPYQYLPPDFVAGPQTVAQPTRVNATVLYAVCLYHHITVPLDSTVEYLAYLVRLIGEDSTNLRSRLSQYLATNPPRQTLLNLLASLKQPTISSQPSTTVVLYGRQPTPVVTHESLALLPTYLRDPSYLRRQISPHTAAGAVALAALEYQLDISTTRDPRLEYQALRYSDLPSYVPEDPWFRHWYQQNPSLFDLRRNFNPLFPMAYYSETTMREMLLMEGYRDQGGEPYELLQIAHLAPTFYVGDHPSITSRTTTINLEDLADIPYGSLLSYGCKGEGQLAAISLEELTAAFLANKNFSNPLQKDATFPAPALAKLKYLLTQHVVPDPRRAISPTALAEHQHLLLVIANTEQFISSVDGRIQLFLQAYQRYADKPALDNLLQQLLHLAMYMRGWSGSGGFPTTSELALVPRDQQGQVYLNVTRALQTFEQSCVALGELGRQFSQLPLLRYHAGEYQASESANEGLTIQERLNIVKEGRLPTACIRMSSNWLASTAHKLMLTVGLPAPFPIAELARIS